MSWIYLLIAGVFETAWAIGLKYTEGFTKLYPSLWTAASMILSLYFLSLSLKTLPIGTAYAVWTGIGALGAFIFGIVLFKEPIEFWRIFFISLLIISLVGLKSTSGM
jgi:quaternary ammonium compound-resistance protein SugE